MQNSVIKKPKQFNLPKHFLFLKSEFSDMR